MGNRLAVGSGGGGYRAKGRMEHRNKEGELISQSASPVPPAAPECLTPSCMWRYWKDATFYVLLCSYNRRRVMYAEANRDKPILERYRTGEPQPETLWQAIHANIKLKCPVCRKYNKDPLLFRREE